MSAGNSQPFGRPIVSADARKRLQQCYESAVKSAATGNFDYAIDMLKMCVVGDPGNQIYVKQMLGSLLQKFKGDPKQVGKLASMQVVGPRGKLKLAKDGPAMIGAGVEVLKINPWDTTALCVMASACEKMECDEAGILYLNMAIGANPKEADFQRARAKMLERLGQFDEAILCWNKVAQLKPSDFDAQKMISNLSVKRTIKKSGMEDTETAGDLARKTAAEDRPSANLTPQQKLEKAIARAPEERSNYLDLADLLIQEEKYGEAEKVIEKVVQLSGGDMAMIERLEDVRLRRGRQTVGTAERLYEQSKTEDSLKTFRQVQSDVTRAEMDIYRARCDRYPANLSYKFELALRLKKFGQINEAIQLFQAARGDGKRRATVHLELGECFQHLKQYKLAMSNYEQAVQDFGSADSEPKRLAMYRAGRLSLATKDLETAEKYLTEVASLDFGYKDVAALLDKIAQERNNQ
jgi:tetratricopeptide (TPR) repeat protein